jgi:hypothetical protein
MWQVLIWIFFNASVQQWSEPVTLPNVGEGRILGIDVVIDHQGTLHCVWDQGSDTIEGRNEIFYSFWDDSTWSHPLNISNTSTPSTYPLVIIDSSNRIHIFWGEDLRASPDHLPEEGTDIFYSFGDGKQFSLPVSLCHMDSIWSVNAELMTAGITSQDKIYIYFHWFGHDLRDKYIWWDGSKWSDTLTTPYKGSIYPSLVVDNNDRIHLSYIGADPHASSGTNDVLYGAFRGDTWTEPVLVHRSDGWDPMSFETQIAVDKNGKIYVVWCEDYDGDYCAEQILYASSTDGITFGDTARVSNYPNGFSGDLMGLSLAKDINVNLHLAYAEYTPSFSRAVICYTKWNGKVWSNIEKIDAPQGLNQRPKIVAGADKIHLIWNHRYGPTEDSICYSTKSASGIISSPWDNNLKSVQLFPNRPNPFHDRTEISFQIVEPSFTTLKVYDNTGRVVTTLIEKRLEQGRYEVSWDGKDHAGRRLPNGIYFYTLRAGNFSETSKVLLVR